MQVKEKAQTLRFDQITVGDVFEFTQHITEEMVDAFAALTGDYNPLHVDEAYATNSEFGFRVVHGALLSAFFSQIIGMMCPGERSLYISQDTQYRQPVLVDSTVHVRAEVINTVEALNMVELRTQVLGSNGELSVDGCARVKVRDI